MTEPADRYQPIREQEQLRKQALRVWYAAAAVVSIWVALLVAPAILSGTGDSEAATPFYFFFSYICHQIPERSLFLMEHQLAVCSRCFGVYFGLLAGLFVYPLWRSVDEVEPLPRFWLFAAMVPIAIDWSLGVFGIWENNHVSRFVTGLILGFACATYIVPALVEIARNLSSSDRAA